MGCGEQGRLSCRAINTHFPVMLWHNFQSQSRREFLTDAAEVWVCPFPAPLSPHPRNRCHSYSTGTRCWNIISICP